MARKSRTSLRSSTRARRISSPKVDEDEVTQDFASPKDQSQPRTPVGSQTHQPDENEKQVEDGDANDEVNNVPQSSDHEEVSNPSTPRILPVKRGRGRGRGRGRPSLRRGSLRSTPDQLGEEGSDGTPARRGRGRGRGGFRGTRGRGRGANRGPSHVTRVPIDKEGNMMDVIEDEVVQPEDPEGETKVDKMGNLQGGREYRVRTFPIAGRGDRLYMLSTEPARCTGFRDSYLFFNKHMALFKIILDDEEKRDLIERELIPHSYKGRAIGVVTARSVFREFGSKIVVGGKKITDDYQVAKARERGDIEGELVDPFDKMPEAGQKYDRNQYVAWHGASSVYHTQGPNAQVPGRAQILISKKKPTITSANWMHEHALAASAFNSALNMTRKAVSSGVYDPHTNIMCYPAATQPTHVKWKRVPTSLLSPLSKKRKLETINSESTYLDSYSHQGQQRGVQADSLTNGKAPDDNENDNIYMVNNHSYPISNPTQFSSPVSTTMSTPFNQTFAAPSEFLKNNYLLVDTHYSTPPSSLFSLSFLSDGQAFGSAGQPSHQLDSHRDYVSLDSNTLGLAQGHDFSAGRPPHLGIPTISEREMEDVNLPDECREALREARQLELKWRSNWAGTEVLDGGRAPLRLGVGI